MTIHYTPRGPHEILLDAETTAKWHAGDRDQVMDLARRRADGTGHTCDVFADNGTDLLYQAPHVPAPARAPAPAAPTLLGGLASWLKRNTQDPGDDGEDA